MSSEHTETHRRPEQTTASGKRPPLMAMMANVWGMGVVLGPTLVLKVFAAASTLAVVSGRVFKLRGVKDTVLDELAESQERR